MRAHATSPPRMSITTTLKIIQPNLFIVPPQLALTIVADGGVQWGVYMSVFPALLAVVVFIALLLVTAMFPVRSRYSHAELKRRAEQSEKWALELDRYELYPALVTLLNSVQAVVSVALVCVLIWGFGWLWGVVVVLLVVLLSPGIARIQGVKKASSALYKGMESALLNISAKFEGLLHALRAPGVVVRESPQRLHSQEELAELIERSHDVIGENERALLVSALAFSGKTVSTILTPRADIAFIKKNEFLGPLVLDELHALGHSRLPVVDKDLDSIIGILHLRDLLSLDVKRSVTAEKAMEKKVYYVNENHTLEHVLSKFLRTRHHLCIVTNENKETVGLVTLEDVVEALIGRRIIDEHDSAIHP